VGTRHEALLGQSLQRLGLRAARNAADLPGRPDLVFRTARVAVFCDGDFWHGRNWTALRKRLAHRANANYWIAKIAYNIRRDAHQRRALRKLGWAVLRFWESDITKNPQRVADRIRSVVRGRSGEFLHRGVRGKIGAQT
jgi:DNA mismatch endonuclease (patch repair protein)